MRVLALTRDTSLQVALESMMPDWELLTVHDPARATKEALTAGAALIDLGTTERGLAAARALREDGLVIPCVVIGDEAGNDEFASVVIRPFSLTQLSDAVARASEEAAEAAEARAVLAEIMVAEPASEPEPEPQPEPEPEPEPEDPDPIATLLAESGMFAPEPVARVVLAAPARAGTDLLTRPVTRKRLRRTLAPVAAPAKPGSIMLRLKSAVASARDLDALLAELPALREPRAVAHVFLGEVVDQFGPQTAAVYIRRSDGAYGVLAPHGLSSIEAELRVAPDQPLFAEVVKERAGVFIAPVDLAQGLVAGIGGARTEALMAAPLEAAGEVFGIVIVGGAGLVEADLRRLCDLAAEGAPGLALAQMIERLRSRL